MKEYACIALAAAVIVLAFCAVLLLNSNLCALRPTGMTEAQFIERMK